MIRKTFLMTAAIVALTLGSLSAPAGAQCTKTYDGAIVSSAGCLDYPAGGFGSSAAGTATATPTPRPFATATAVTESTTATGTGEATIAFTGAESRTLGYVGAGLIGLGAVALAAARRKNESDHNA